MTDSCTKEQRQIQLLRNSPQTYRRLGESQSTPIGFNSQVVHTWPEVCHHSQLTVPLLALRKNLRKFLAKMKLRHPHHLQGATTAEYRLQSFFFFLITMLQANLTSISVTIESEVIMMTQFVNPSGSDIIHHGYTHFWLPDHQKIFGKSIKCKNYSPSGDQRFKTLANFDWKWEADHAPLWIP